MKTDNTIGRKIRDCLVWLMMLSKRLLKTPSFIVLLLLIPLCGATLRLSFSDDSGVLRIGLYSEGSAVGDEIMNSLLNKDSIVTFTEYPSEEAARTAVMEDKIQGAWIFPKNIEENIALNAKYGGTSPLAKVIEREDTIPLKLSHELLYGSLHPYVAYANYESFIGRKYGDAAPRNEETLRYHYENGKRPGEILVMKVVGKEQPVKLESNLLTLPMRGILSLLCVLCGLACAMYFKSDNKKGIYDRLAPERRIIPAVGTILPGVAISCIAVLISLYFVGIGTDFLRELLAMLLYIPAVTFFCLAVMSLARSPVIIGSIIPFVMILMLVQCPIFLNADGMRPLWWLFPPSYYLYAVYDWGYLGYMAIYSVVAGIAGSFFKVLDKR